MAELSDLRKKAAAAYSASLERLVWEHTIGANVSLEHCSLEQTPDRTEIKIDGQLKGIVWKPGFALRGVADG